MHDFSQAFEERLQEIDSYLNLLEVIEKQVQKGLPQFKGDDSTITVQQQRMLYSSVYLQLYNLVESTVTQCVDTISDIVNAQELQPDDLCDALKREWVRLVARTHIDLSSEKRLESAMALCDHVASSQSISEFNVERGGGGNWDDQSIHKFTKRLGLSLEISREAQQAVKQPFKNDMGTLSLIKDYRNKLAHGNISFAECGENVTVHDLRQLTEHVALYMGEVVGCFKQFLDTHEFLSPTRKAKKSIV
jgi:MAE_28990/MAE_18760-like HEPN